MNKFKCTKCGTIQKTILKNPIRDCEKCKNTEFTKEKTKNIHMINKHKKILIELIHSINCDIEIHRAYLANEDDTNDQYDVGYIEGQERVLQDIISLSGKQGQK